MEMAIEPEALRQILDAPDASTLKGMRDQAMLALMANGLRVSKVASLNVDLMVRPFLDGVCEN